MKRFQLLLLVFVASLAAVSTVGCESASQEQAPLVATQPATAISAAETGEPAATPEPTSIPAPTATPEPTASATPVPLPTATLAPTATPTFTPTPTPTSTPVPIRVAIEGSGSNVETVNLIEGLYIVTLEVSGNESCLFGSCSSTNFIASIEGVDGGTGSLANEIASEWSGSATLRIGTGLFEVTPGTQVVSVNAEGDWSITFDSASGVQSAERAGNTVTLTGSGTKSQVVMLPEGLYTAAANVTANENCFFGSCSGTNFIVSIEGLEQGTGGLVNEIASEWSGSTTVRIGTGLFEIPPRTQVVSVHSAGDWTVTFEFLG